MANTGYFSNFPVINYCNTNVVDITRRAVFANSSLKNPFVFYPYDLSGNERADQFAYRYYGDPFEDWIVYLSNEIIDPYYDWYLSDDDFNNFIIKKYGSIQEAQSKIYYYEDNWYSWNNISISDYDALPDSLFKYWEPIFGLYDNVVSYKRSNTNNTITTNHIRMYNISSNTFIKDEICNIVFDSNNTGNGQILSVTGNNVYIQHTSGVTIANVSGNSYIYGQDSQTNASMLSVISIADTLLPEEEVYWSPVSYYQDEYNKNESKKTIEILDSDYASIAVSNLRETLK